MWQHENLERMHCSIAEFAPRDSKELVEGIYLVHTASKPVAVPGDVVIFTTWILNETNDALTDIALELRSLSNESMEYRHYQTRPSALEMVDRTVPPQQVLSYSYTYRVGPADVNPTGLLISAIGMELTHLERGTLYAECDAILTTVQEH